MTPPNIQQLIQSLTADEKLALLGGQDNWRTVAVERLGIPALMLADGPHGLRVECTNPDGKRGSREATCFPTASSLAATWNLELVRRVGAALGDECGAYGVDVLLGPGTNIKRTPLCGRNFEYFSEDPLLAGRLAAAYIEGVQSRGVGTSLKHYAANNQEYDRSHISSEVDERALREIYLKPFELAVRAARPWTLMCAYNRLNGTYCSENHRLLSELLRDEWGFEGIVVSDWGAVHDRVRSLQASLELEMPFAAGSVETLRAALADGRLSWGEVDAAVARLLAVVLHAAELRPTRATRYDRDAHHALAHEAALESIILLKNERGVLPLRPEVVRRVAVIGQYASRPQIQGGGSAGVHTEHVTNPLDAIRAQAGSIVVEFAHAYLDWHTLPAVDALGDAMTLARSADVVLLFVGDNARIETEGYDRSSIRLLPHQEDIVHRITGANPNTVVIVQAGSAIDMSPWIDRAPAVVMQGFAGEAGGSALAEILFGVTSPSGKTTETYPLRLEDTPAHRTYPGNGFVTWYAEGVLVGYRHYDAQELEVLFPFGFGLSYTTFEYSGLRVERDGASVRVFCKVRNTGSFRARETVQLYVASTQPRVLRPPRELQAFAKLELEPGAERELQLDLGPEAFAIYDTNARRWQVPGGDYQLLVGASSRDIRLTASVTVPDLGTTIPTPK